MANASSTSAPAGAGLVVLRVVARVVAMAFLAYAAAAAIVAAGVAVPVLAGANKTDAFNLSSLLGFALYVTFALWVSATRRLGMTIIILLAVTAAGAAIGFLPKFILGI